MSVPAPSQPAPEPCPAPALSRYRVRALADPSALSRVLEQFVLRDLLPARVHCERAAGGEELRIEVEVADLAEPMAHHLARRLGAFPVVMHVLLQRG